MSILIVAIVLLIVHVTREVWPQLRCVVLSGYFVSIQKALARINLANAFGMALAIVLPLVVVGLLQWWLRSLPTTWPWFLFSLVVLLLSWGSRDLDADVDAFVEACDQDAARDAAEPLISSYRKPHPTSTREAVVKGVFYQGLVRWFGVLFWFLILGAVGALLFRLPHAALTDPPARESMTPRQIALAKRLAGLLDFIPATLTTLGLAIVGNFDAVIEAWKAHARSPHPHTLAMDYEFLPEVGYRVVCNGEATEEAFASHHQTACQEVRTAMNLVWRTLLGWLTIAALLVLAGLLA